MALLESVPNVSEGRDASVVAAIADAFARAGARVLDTHLDGDHNRAVITLVGDDEALEEGLVAGIDEASRRIDLRMHDGVHPRVGAADVVPVVPLAAGRPRAGSGRRPRGRRDGSGTSWGSPCSSTARSARAVGPRSSGAAGRASCSGGSTPGELEPAYGPRRLDPAAGAVLLGVRKPLVAFNLELRGTLDVARDVAAAVRESSGGLPGVQALGLRLGGGRIQVSTNVIDLDATAPHVMVERIVSEAAARGAEVGRGSSSGCCPLAASRRPRGPRGSRIRSTTAAFRRQPALDAAARALRLQRLDADRVLEWHLV